MSSFINFLKRNKLYSAVNLLGLSLSMAFVLLLAVYVTSQLNTDSFQKNADRIYVIAQNVQFPSREGDFSEWKASISGVLISESFAKAQFGDRDPVGREIRFDGADSTVSNLTVSGVFKDIENSIIRPCDIFLRGEIMTITNQANDERMSRIIHLLCDGLSERRSSGQTR